MLLIIGAKYQWELTTAQQRWICDLILLVLPVFIVTPRKEQKVGQHEWIPESGSYFTCPRFGTVTKFCKAHGGGKRRTVLGCTKGAEGSTVFCKAYGGGKRCSFQDGGVCSKGCMVAPYSVLRMVVGRGVLLPSALRVQEDGQISVSAMVGVSDASMRAVGRAHREALTSARHMVGATGPRGVKWDQILVLVDRLVTGLLEEKLDFVALIQDCYVHGGRTLAHTMTKFPAGIKHEKVVETAAERDELSKMADGGDSSADWEDLDAMVSMHPSTPFHSESISILGRVHGGSIMALLSAVRFLRTK